MTLPRLSLGPLALDEVGADGALLSVQLVIAGTSNARNAARTVASVAIAIHDRSEPPQHLVFCHFKTISLHTFARRSRSALAMTDTELKLIAAAEIIGLRTSPQIG
jgi:hypothetical protein